MTRPSIPIEEIRARYRDMLRRAFGDVDDSSIELFGNLMRAQHLISSVMERHMSQYDLSRAKLGLLMWLNTLDKDGAESGLLPSQLSKMQGVMPNTVSSLLNSLREQGLIEQLRHPQDRRKRIICITQAGRDLLAEVGPHYHGFVRELFAGLTDDEKKDLIALMHKMFQSIEGAVQKFGHCPQDSMAKEQHNAQDGEDHDGEQKEASQDHRQRIGSS